MKRLRRVAGGAALMLSVAIALPWVQTVDSAPVESEQHTPWDDARSCTTSSPDAVLYVQMMVDASKSLQTSDKQNSREYQLRLWMDTLSELAARGNTVRIALATYGTVWTPRLDWSTLTPELASSVDSLINTLPKDELDTDHIGGLLNAQMSLADEERRVVAQQHTGCPMLLWFTDGVYDFDRGSPKYRRERGYPLVTAYSPLQVNGDNESKIVKAGLQLACGAGGVVDQLRSRSISILAVALGNLDFRLVQELAAGTGFAAGDASGGCDLAPYSRGFVGPAPEPPPPPPPSPCDGGVCVSSTTFSGSVLARSARVGIRLAAEDADAGSIKRVSIVSPDGSHTDLTPAASGDVSTSVGGHRATLTTLGSGAVSLKIVPEGDGRLVGEWMVEVERTLPDVSVLFDPKLIADFAPVLRSPSAIAARSDNPVEVELIDDNGAPVSAELASKVRLSATIGTTGDSVTLEPTTGAKFAATIPQTDIPDGAETIDVVLLPSTDEDVVLASVAVTLPISWPGYALVTFPDAVNGVVRPGIFDTPGNARVTYVVTGPSSGTSCVTPSVSSMEPKDAPSVSLAFEVEGDDCVTAGDQLVRTVTLRVDDRYFGSFCGDVVFSLKSDADPEVRTTRQTICITTDKGGTWYTLLFAILAGIFGIVLPFLLLWGVNRFLGRLPAEGMLTVHQVGVTKGPDGVRRQDGRPLLSEDELADLAEASLRTRRSLAVAQERVRVEARAAVKVPHRWRLSPTMLVTGPRNYLVANNLPTWVGVGDDVIFRGVMTEPLTVPLNLDGLWVLVPSLAWAPGEGQQAASATLVVFREFGFGRDVFELVPMIRAALNESEFDDFLQVTKGESPDDFD